MKKVMHLLQSNQFSGAENVVCQIFEMFKDDSNVEMIYVSSDGPIRQALESRNIKYIGLDKLNYRNVKKVIKDYRPDIIHAHDVSASILAGITKRNGIKVISHMHVNNSNMSKINFKTCLYLFSSIFYEHIFWVSKSSLDGYKFSRFVNKKSTVLFNVMYKDKIFDRAQKAKLQEKFDIVYIGRLCYQKNPEKVLEILKELKKINYNFKAGIIGDGLLYEEIKSRIDILELSKNVKMFGFVDNPLGMLRNSKVLMLASRYEGTPMCALEAMGLGIPIVSTPTDGMKDLIQSGKNGFLEQENKKFAEYLNEIISNEILQDKFSKEIEKTFDTMMNIQEYKDTLFKVYELDR